MKYPTLEEVEKASRLDLGTWMRHLPCAGANTPEGQAPSVAEATRLSEAKVLDRIRERFQELGGWNPILSKAVGWESPYA